MNQDNLICHICGHKEIECYWQDGDKILPYCKRCKEEKENPHINFASRCKDYSRTRCYLCDGFTNWDMDGKTYWRVKCPDETNDNIDYEVLDSEVEA